MQKKLFSDDKGSLYAEELSNDVLATRIEGYMTLAMAQALVAEFDRFLRGHSVLRAAHDWADMSSYAGEGRSFITDYCLRERRRIGECHILVKSAMVSMGVNTAAIALKAVGISISSTTERSLFEQRRTVLAGKPRAKAA